MDDRYIELTECIEIEHTARMKCIFCGIYMDYCGKYRFMIHSGDRCEERVMMYFICGCCRHSNQIRFKRDERHH